MNFLTVMLCITMNRPYQFYQFVPLATFAFVMQYAVMICPPHVTAPDVDINLWKYAYMLIKFIVFGFISTILYMSQVIIHHSLIRGVLIQSCSAGAKNLTNYVFCHPQFSSVIQNIENHCAILTPVCLCQLLSK